MAVRPERVEDWFHLAPGLLSQDGWETSFARPLSTLSHCVSPWGGHLIRFSYQDITIADAPENTAGVLVRPEVRAWVHRANPSPGSSFEVLNQLAPGDAVVKRWASWGFLRLCSVLFGDLAGHFMNYFFYDPAKPTEFHQRVRRDYPERGDSACAFFDQSEPLEGILVCRPQGDPDKFMVNCVLRVPEDKFANWAKIHYMMLLESGRRTAQWFLNRPGISEMRSIDQQFYVVLAIHSFKRGMPQLPVQTPNPGDAVTRIDAGQRMGLTTWVCYHPGMTGSSKFYLSDYIQLFLENIGASAQTYNLLDGRQLVPYQCVVAREEWNSVRARFCEAFTLQKTAYRRANGGSSAPGMHEGVEPRFLPDADLALLRERIEFAQQQPKIVVRNTFVEMDEEDDEEEDEEFRVERNTRRLKTSSHLRVDCSVLAA